MLLYYLNFRFKINQHEVILRKGILKKSVLRLILPKYKVWFSHPFYFSPFNWWIINLIQLAQRKKRWACRASLEFANRMRDNIFDYREWFWNSNRVVEPSQEQSKGLTLSNIEVAKFGLMSGMAFLYWLCWLLFLIVLPVMQPLLLNRFQVYRAVLQNSRERAMSVSALQQS